MEPTLAQRNPIGSVPSVPAPSEWSRALLGAAFLSFFLVTVALFFWGPWHYPLDAGRGRLVLFLTAVHVAFAVGYFGGTRGAPRASRRAVPIGTLVLVAAFVDLALLFPTSLLNTGRWIPRPGEALGDLATAYSDSLALRNMTRPYVNYVRILAAPVFAIVVPLGVFYWRRLSWAARVLVALSVVGNIALFVAMGANAGAAHWMALFPWFVLAAHLARVQRLDWKGWTSAIVVQVLSIALFAALFAATMNQRAGSFAKYGSLPGIGAQLATDVKSASGAAAPPVASTTATAPVGPASAAPAERSAARIGADGLAGYLTQGYFAVYLSLQEPFVPTYGVGNSMFLLRQAARIVGDPTILKRPYPERIQRHGWNAYGYWATIYPWLASDVTFPGVVLVVFAIGWMAGRVWLDVLGGANPFAVVFLGQILILLYYFPAHNKVMHSGEGVLAFWVWLAAWALLRRRASPGTPAA
jgi:hypothetical protein